MKLLRQSVILLMTLSILLILGFSMPLQAARVSSTVSLASQYANEGADTGNLQVCLSPIKQDVPVLFWHSEDWNDTYSWFDQEAVTDSTGCATFTNLPVDSSGNLPYYQVSQSGYFKNGKDYRASTKGWISLIPGDTKSVTLSPATGGGTVSMVFMGPDGWYYGPSDGSLWLETSNDTGYKMFLADGWDTTTPFKQKTTISGTKVIEHLPPDEISEVETEANGGMTVVNPNTGDSVAGAKYEIQVQEDQNISPWIKLYNVGRVTGQIVDASGDTYPAENSAADGEWYIDYIYTDPLSSDVDSITDRYSYGGGSTSYELYSATNGSFNSVFPVDKFSKMKLGVEFSKKGSSLWSKKFIKFDQTPDTSGESDPLDLGEITINSPASSMMNVQVNDYNHLYGDSETAISPFNPANIETTANFVLAAFPAEWSSPEKLIVKGFTSPMASVTSSVGGETAAGMISVSPNSENYFYLLNLYQGEGAEGLSGTFSGGKKEVVGDSRSNIVLNPDTTTPRGDLKGEISTSDNGLTYLDKSCVFVMDESANSLSGLAGYALPGRNGKYIIRNLPAGEYTIIAGSYDDNGNLYQPTDIDVSISGGQTTTKDIVLTKGKKITGYVDSGSGNSLGGVKVSVVGEDISDVSGSDGSYKLTGLTTGEYTVRAETSGYQTGEKQVKISSDQASVSEDFALAGEAGQISGRIKNSAGEWLAELPVVACSDSSGVTRKTTTDAAGTYVLTGLPPAADYQVTTSGQAANGEYYKPKLIGEKVSVSSGITNDLGGDTVEPALQFSVRTSRDPDNPDNFKFTIEANQKVSKFSVNAVGITGSLSDLTTADSVVFEATYSRQTGDETMELGVTGTLANNNSVTETDTFAGIDVSSQAPEEAASSQMQVNEERTGENTAVDIPDEVEVDVPAFGIVANGDTTVVQVEAESRANHDTPPAGTELSNFNDVKVLPVEASDTAKVNANVGFKVRVNYDTGIDFALGDVQIKYFDTGTQSWKTGGISGIKINRLQKTLVFRTKHLTEFTVVESSTTEEETDSSSSSSSGGCLIEQSGAPKWMQKNLRDFRDLVLNSSVGRYLTNQYYDCFGAE